MGETKRLTIDTAITEAQARRNLNATMLKLRTRYGFAPAKGVSLDAMKERYNTLSDALEMALNEYVEATGQLPAKMRNTAPYKTSKAFPKRKYSGLQAHANVPDDRLKRAPLHTVEAAGNLLVFNADYLLKYAHEAAVKARTRKEWRRAEYEYVEKSDYNLRDLYDDLITRLDAPEGGFTYEDYRKERKKWRQCRYYACDNYFPIATDHMQSHAFRLTRLEARRKDSRYCCDECRKAQENALVRLERTGTLLPAHAYEYILDDAREKREQKEVATESEKMEEIADI